MSFFRSLFNRSITPSQRVLRIAAIDQQAFNSLQIWLAPVDGSQRTVAVRHLGRGHGDGVGQSLRVNGDVAPDAGDLFARVAALLLGAVGSSRSAPSTIKKPSWRAPQFLAGLANGFF